MFVQFQGLPDAGQVGFPLTLLDLVVLVGHHHEGFARVLKPLGHDTVVLRGLVAQVHNEHPQGEQVCVGKPLLDELAPPSPLLLGDFGVAVAGKVHKVDLPVDAEIVDVGGFPRGGAHSGEILPPQQAVDHRGLAHVGPAGKGDLGQGVPGTVGHFGRRADKLGFLCVQFHGVSSQVLGKEVWALAPALPKGTSPP